MAVMLLQAGTQNEQRVHIKTNMQNVGMQQHRSDQPPNLAGQDQLIDLLSQEGGVIILINCL